MDATSGVATDSDEAIIHVRQRIFDTLHLVSCLIAPFTVFFIVERVLSFGSERHAIVVLAVTLAIVAAYLYRGRIAYCARVVVVLAGYLLVATSSVMSNGLVSTGNLLFLMTPVLAVILLGVRGGVGVLLLASALYTLGATAVVYGWVTPVLRDVATIHLSGRAWVDRGVQMLMLIALLGAASAALDGTLVRMIRRLTTSERQLAHRESLYRGVFNGVADAILVHDSAGRIVDANPRASELFECKHDEMMLLTIHQLLTGSDEPHEALVTALAGARERGSDSLEWMIRPSTSGSTPAKRARWIELSLHVIEVDGAERMLVTARDVTARKEIDQERTDFLLRERQAREHAEVANRAKDHFLAVLSHELRTPLTPVLLTLSGWRDDPTFPREHLAELEMVTEQIKLETSLINDLLDVTRVSRGTLRLEPSVHDVHELIREAVQMTRAPGGPPIVVELNARTPAANLDPLRFRQVIWNLLTNAQKFTPPDGKVRVTTSSPPDDPGTVRVDVTDTGAGIPPKQLARIFTPFEQGATAGNRPAGLGLGLAIARAIVIAHGGKLTARSAGPGKGSTFTIELPLVDAGPTALSPEPETPEMTPLAEAVHDSTQHPCSGGEAPSPQVLLVEDHEHTAKTLARVLSGSGYRVRVAHNVAEAIRSLDDAAPDLLVSDIGLPDGSGIDIMTHVFRQHLPTKGIAITGYGMDEDIAQTKSAGFAAHLTKPITIDELLGAMKRLTTQL